MWGVKLIGAGLSVGMVFFGEAANLIRYLTLCMTAHAACSNMSCQGDRLFSGCGSMFLCCIAVRA